MKIAFLRVRIDRRCGTDQLHRDLTVGAGPLTKQEATSSAANAIKPKADRSAARRRQARPPMNSADAATATPARALLEDDVFSHSSNSP